MNRIQRISSPVLVTIFAIMISACGFQLRGTMDIASDLESLSVQTTDRGFQRILVRMLTQTGISIDETAPYKVNVLDLSREELISSTSGGNIVTDYEVTATLKWQLEDETGLILIPESELTQYGTYQKRSDEYNASRTELETVWKELQQNLAMTLTRRLASLTDAQLQELATTARELKAAASKSNVKTL